MTGPVLLLVLALGAVDGGVAVPEALRARVSPEKVRLGEPFTYEVAVTHAPQERYELQVPQQTVGAFEVLSQSRRREDGQGRAVTTFQLQLAAFELGELSLPRFSLEATAAGATGKLQTPPARVEVVPSVPDGEGQGAALQDLKPLEEVRVTTYRWLWWALGLLAAAALGYWLYRRFRNRPAPPPPVVPPAPLAERTLAALEALRAENLPAQGQAREFYFRLSEILRSYLGERFHFEALECTSAELLVRLEAFRPAGLDRATFAELVHRSDLVKFAKAPADPEVCLRDLEFGVSMVRDTTPQPPPQVK